ncbi:3525_t:CDS:1, partial [Paraglomus occultum]
LTKDKTKLSEVLSPISRSGQLPVLAIPIDHDHNNETLRESARQAVLDGTPSVIPVPSTSTFLTESNAILLYLASSTPLLPSSNPLHVAQINEWLFWEQHSHEPNIATLRWWLRFMDLGEDERYLDQIVEKQKRGYKALEVMEKHLDKREWFINDEVCVVDVALYAYTCVCEEGGFSIDSFPNVKKWLKRFEGLPGYIGIDD